MKVLSVLMIAALLAGWTLAALLPQPAGAGRSTDTVVCAAEGIQMHAKIVNDGAGGAIISWIDYRNPDICDVYTQRLDAAGVPQWTTDGVYICTTDLGEHAMASDGAGGAIVVGQQILNGQWAVYAQRVDSSGALQWNTDGLVIATTAYHPSVIDDGSAGAIIAWHGPETGEDRHEIRLQRVNAVGAPQWGAGGVRVCTSEFDRWKMTGDGLGGAIVAWSEGPHYTSDIYAQRLDSSGTAQWGPNGIPVCTSPELQSFPVTVGDGSGGAIIAWHDARTGKNQNIYAQMVNAAGVPQWTADGVLVSSDGGLPAIIGDGSGGAILAWLTGCYDPGCDIIAQRLDASGSPLWSDGGAAVCTAPGKQTPFVMASNGSEGAVLAWLDSRRSESPHVYAQRMDASGSAQWAENGVALYAGSDQPFDPAIVNDGSGGTIITWQLFEAANIYAQRIDASGHPGWHSAGPGGDSAIPTWTWILIGAGAICAAVISAWLVRRRLARH